MIRIFNHYLHRQTVAQVLFDSALLVLVVLGVLASQSDQFLMVAPLATTQALSFAAGVAVIGTASGIYQRAGRLSSAQIFARAALYCRSDEIVVALTERDVAVPDALAACRRVSAGQRFVWTASSAASRSMTWPRTSKRRWARSGSTTSMPAG
jgi:hypothetical protein